MDTFFTLLKKSLVATVFIIFGFVATYIPNPYTENIPEAEASWPVYDSAAVTVLSNILATQQGILATEQGILALEKSLVEKEFILDRLAFILVKATLSSMMSSMVDWINSGFQGRPMFVEDVQGFLLEASDRAFGEYIDELGGIGSFICSPFRLDIQIALELQYQQSRMNQPAPTCTLTGIIDNIEGFMTGTQGSFAQGGWNDWFDITSQPNVYTPFGALMSAQSGAQARIENARGEEFALLNFGNGFLSTKECTDSTGPDGIMKQICSVTTPGKTIEQALSFNLDTGRESLVAADEINEVIGALLGQLMNQVFGKAGGLLGGL